MVSATFEGSGTATLDFGNCYTHGITRVYLNSKIIGSALPNTISVTTNIKYKPGDVLKITEEDMGIIKINSLKLTC